MANMFTLASDSYLDLSVIPVIQKLLAAQTIASCHAALSETVDILQLAILRPIELVGEVATNPQGQMSFTWRRGDLLGRKSAVPAALQDWFARARQQPGRFCALDDNITGLTMAGGPEEIALHVLILIECDPAGAAPLEAALRDIAAIAAQQLHRLRMDAENSLIRKRLRERAAIHTELLRASTDLLWEAGNDGLIHITQVFNNRGDLARHFEGRPLHALTVADGKTIADLAAHSGTLRAMRLDPGKAIKGTPALYITVNTLPPGSGPKRLIGTISAGPDIAADRLALDARLLENMLGARAREDELRREAEMMLLGLRALLSPAPFHEKLDQLARHLADAMNGDAIAMIQLQPNGEMRSLLATGTLPSAGTSALRRVFAAAAGRDVAVLEANSEESMITCAAFAVQAGDIALIAIPYQAERFYLVCRARRVFSSRDIRLAERFSLLLRQALILRDDQDQMIHAAKLSALGQMSANIAHEMRQPLNTISIAAQNIEVLIERDAITPEILKEKVARVLQQVDRACKVMDRMRRFGRKSNSNRKNVRLSQIAQSAATLMQRSAEKAGIRMETHIPDALEVVADALEIEQVLVNLIQNAIDAISDAQAAAPQGRIKLWACIDPDDRTNACLHVEDNGPGFSPEVQQFAMDAFFTTKKQGKGTGLGLSISHAILREQGGRLSIGNTGQGGRVTLYLRRPPKDDGANIIFMDRRRDNRPAPDSPGNTQSS